MSDGLADWALLEKPADTTARRWVVNLHGHGSTGDQLFTRHDIRTDWLPRFRELGLGVFAPNLRGNAWMSPAAVFELRAQLRWLRETHDAGDLLLVGGSMGGTGCITYATLHPDDIAGVVAMCPATDIQDYHQWCVRHKQERPVLADITDAIERAYGGTPAQHPDYYAPHRAILHTSRLRMPLAVIHGDNDAVIPVEQSRALAQHMKDTPGFIYQELPGGDHDAPLKHCRDGLDWVLEKLDGGG